MFAFTMCALWIIYWTNLIYDWIIAATKYWLTISYLNITIFTGRLGQWKPTLFTAKFIVCPMFQAFRFYLLTIKIWQWYFSLPNISVYNFIFSTLKTKQIMKMSNRIQRLFNKNYRRISAAIGLYIVRENYLFIKMHWLFNFNGFVSQLAKAHCHWWPPFSIFFFVEREKINK